MKIPQNTQQGIKGIIIGKLYIWFAFISAYIILNMNKKGKTMEKEIITILATQDIAATQKLLDDGLDLSKVSLAGIMVDIYQDRNRKFSEEYLKFLIENSIDLNSATKGGYTPLMISIIGELNEIKYLLMGKRNRYP